MTAPGRVLVVGRTGQVARALCATAWGDGLAAEARGRDGLDLRDARAVADAIAQKPWAAVVNAAAYTAVDRAESEREAAFALNAEGPALLARACAGAGVPLVHISTDYVFDGEKTGAYTEGDPVNPLSVYGMSKEAGERAVRDAHDAHVILRTSWVFSETGQNFVKTILRLGRERSAVSVVADQHGRPTAASAVAAAVATIVSALHAGKRDGFGTFHFAGRGETTWHGFAEEILRRAAARRVLSVPELKAITTAEYPTPARRPRNSVLDTARIERIYGIAPRSWTDGLDAVLDKLTAKA